MSDTGQGRVDAAQGGHGEETPFAGRYRIEEEIARGAMGIVSRATDLSTGKKLAIKQLLSKELKYAHLLEREFHALVGLRHPRIIEVFDYGVSMDGPYYTMELLDGQDLHALAPVSYKTACGYLRDVASSLGLLHARRLLHRDLSPRNARVTSDGRCKVIDFGGLCSFGVPDLLLGTPPAVPPEALHHTALDQRADLYALGALGYWLLTGKHAYPVHDFARLHDAWRVRPVAPSEALAAADRADLPSLPAELDDLIMGLLTLNPLGRPASAAQVIDELTAIGGLSQDSEDAVPKSYLVGVQTVGRDGETARLKRRVAAAAAGRGGCVVMEAPAGMGGTRMLSETAVAAQLAGVVPVVVDGMTSREPYALASSLIDKLLEVARPDAIAAAAGHEAILARLSPAMAQACGVAADTTDLSDIPGELRKRTQNALSAWLVELARRRPLLIGVDNLQRVDEPSAVLIAALGTQCHAESLLVVACLKPEQPVSAPAAVRALRTAGVTLTLEGLGRDHVHDLVRLMFGDVPNTTRLSEWMHRVSAGSPQACMDLAEHLVAKEIVVYIHGGWVLPQDLAHRALPRELGELAQQRLAALPAPERAFAEALSVHRGFVPIERCLALAESEQLNDPYSLLESLVQSGVLSGTAHGYQFTQETWREALLGQMEPWRRKRLHGTLGRLLAASAVTEADAQLDAGWHLIHGGEDERGAELLADAGLKLVTSGDGFGTAVPALEAALSVFRRVGKPAHELIRLLGPLAMAGYYSDRRLADTYGEEAVVLLRQVLGIDLAERLRPLLGARLGLYIALGLSAVPFILRTGRGGVSAFIAVMQTYVAVVTTLVGVATICLDGPQAAQMAENLEPLSWLGSDSAPAHVYRMARLISDIPGERAVEVTDGFTALLARVRDPRPIRFMSEGLRRQYYAGVLYALASIRTFSDTREALELADELDQVGLKQYEMVADQVRASYHALRGELALDERFRQRVELHGLQSGSAWQAEVWAVAARIPVYAHTADTIGLKRTVEELQRLASDIPSLAKHARLAQAEYWLLKGDYESGASVILAELEASGDREFIARPSIVGSLAGARNRRGDWEGAKALLIVEIAKTSAQDQQAMTLYVKLFRELAVAHAGLGDFTAAAEVLDKQFAQHKCSDHPLLLGSLHATATRVALAASKIARARKHLEQVARWFGQTNNPSLIRQYERLRREVNHLAEQFGESVTPPHPWAPAATPGSPKAARAALGDCRDESKRGQLALELLLNHVDAQAGFLFRDGQPRAILLAPQHGEEPSTALQLQVQVELASPAQFQEEEETVVLTASAGGPLSSSPPATEAYRTFRLCTRSGSTEQVVGIFAALVGEDPLHTPDPEFLKAIAEALRDTTGTTGTTGTTDTGGQVTRVRRP